MSGLHPGGAPNSEMASPFDRIIIADWSAAAQLSPVRPSADAIWLGFHDRSGATTLYCRGRAEAENLIRAEILGNRGRLLIGFDFPMGYPAGFAAALTGASQASAVWHWLDREIVDGPSNRNNRFEVAQKINLRFGGTGPFWGRPASLALEGLPARKTVNYPALGLPERRRVETVEPRAQPVWKLYTTGAAGSQGLVGQAMLHRLSRLPGVAVWPFDRSAAGVILAEVYPSLLARKVAADPAAIKDEAQVRLLSGALWRLSLQNRLSPLFATPPDAAVAEEGWILGAGHRQMLEAAA